MRKLRLITEPSLFDNVPEAEETNSETKGVVEETASAEISEHDRLMLFTDFIGEDHRLWCYLFRLEVLEKTATIYSTPVIKALLSGLRELMQSRNKRVRERAFTIWGGDYFAFDSYFVVAVPRELPVQVTEVLRRRFELVEGYSTMEGGSLPIVPVVPWFRYEGGTVIEYSDDSMCGKTRLDDDENYGSGLMLHFRQNLPVELNGGRECYGGLVKQNDSG